MTARVRALLLRAPGTNCDRETAEGMRLAGAAVEVAHLVRVLRRQVRLSRYRVVVLPGGFSYGDAGGVGRTLAEKIRDGFLPELHRFIADGRCVIGICNGMQTLLRLGLLSNGREGRIAFRKNGSGRFVCRWVRLRVDNRSPWFRGFPPVIELPVAHQEGRLVVKPEGALRRLLSAGRVPLRYLDNPDGSTGGGAALVGPRGNVCGLMPHPERAVHPEQYPGSHRRPAIPAGRMFFHNAVLLASRGHT